MKISNPKSYLLTSIFLSKVKANNSTGISQDQLVYTNDLPSQDLPLLIPKIFHTVETSDKSGFLANQLDDLKALHPSWEVKTWNEAKIFKLISTNYVELLDTFKAFKTQIEMFEAAKILVLHSFGCVCIDPYFIALRNIEPLLKSYGFVIGNSSEQGFEPGSGIIASLPKIELLSYIISQIKEKQTCGPLLLKKTLYEYALKHGTAGGRTYKFDVFYPLSKDQNTCLRTKSSTELKELYPNCYVLLPIMANHPKLN